MVVPEVLVMMATPHRKRKVLRYPERMGAPVKDDEKKLRRCKIVQDCKTY